MSLKDINKPIDKRLEPIKDLEFTITKEMKENLVDLLAIQQILDENKLSKKERKSLEKQKDEMLEQFRYELHRLNPTQVALCRYFLSNGKKNERDEN